MKHKAIIFDIDDTLISTKERRTNALVKTAQKKELQHIPNIQCAAQYTPDTIPIEFSIDESIKRCNIPKQYLEEIRSYWKDLFLSNESMYQQGNIVGSAIRGALDTVTRAYNQGYKIIYMTGRHHDLNGKDSMKQGTIDELTNRKFPFNVHTLLIMKEAESNARDRKDDEYKLESLHKLAQTYDIVATFDDGPKNVAVFTREIPSAANFAFTVNFPCDQFPSESICISQMNDPVILQKLNIG